MVTTGVNAEMNWSLHTERITVCIGRMHRFTFWLTLTCRVVGILRLSPSMDIFTAILIPAKRRLLRPKIVAKGLFGA